MGDQESAIVLDVVGGQWNSFDVDLAAFQGTNLSQLSQLKFESVTLTDFYMDNIYVGDNTPNVGTPTDAEPDTAAGSPQLEADDVALFIDTVGTIISQLNPGWGQSGSLFAAEIDGAAENVLKVLWHELSGHPAQHDRPVREGGPEARRLV